MNTILGLAELQKMTLGSPKIKIAVLDGPVDLEHPCFNSPNGNLTPWSALKITPSASSGLALKHGTAVASLIFGTPNSAVDGVAPSCSGFFIPIYSEDEDGKFYSASQVELAKSIKIAVEQGAHIINISGGQLSNSGVPEHFLKQAIDDCKKAGVLMIAATGNDGCSCLHVPAADRHVLAVGSMDENGNPTKETNFGPSYQINGILAPGKNRIAARPGGGTFKTSGATSYATPIISGVVGLLMSLQLKEGIQPDAYVIKSILEKTATPCSGDAASDHCNRFLRGQLNLPEAIKEIKKNPGILASGLEFNNKSKLIFMEKHQHQESNMIPETLQEATVILPAATTTETISEKQVPDTNTLVLQKKETSTPEMIVMSPTPQEVVPACACEEEENTEDKNNNALSPSKSKIIMSGEDSSLTNSINTKIKNMENQNLDFSEIILSSPTAVVTPSGQIDPSDCGCGGSAQKPAKVFALGTIGYDFGNEAHRDSFIQSMGGANPHDPAALLAYLEENPWDAEELIWTLELDGTPIYSLIPNGPHAPLGFERIRNFLKEQINGNIQRVSIPGVSAGTRVLLNGQKVSLLVPRLRGMYSWTTEALADATSQGAKGAKKVMAENIGNFLDRIYYQMRNLGVTSEERALNYAATNAFQVSGVFAAALKENLELDTIAATKSPIGRSGSDCYDVVLSFFNPKERLTQARKQYRFTVDVSDIVPVTVGTVRSWSVY